MFVPLPYLLALVLLFGAWETAHATAPKVIASTPSIQLLDANGNAITADTALTVGSRVTVVVDGLEPTTRYQARLGYTDTSNGTLECTFWTDANGHGMCSFFVPATAVDSADAARTVTIHKGTAVPAPTLTSVTYQIQPSVSLALENEVAYSNAANLTWSQLGFGAHEGKVNDATPDAGYSVSGPTDFPYLITVSGFSGKSPHTVTCSLAGTDAILYDQGTATVVTTANLTANGSLSGTYELAIPEVPAGDYQLVCVDAFGNTATWSFTVKPALLVENPSAVANGANPFDPRADVLIQDLIDQDELVATVGQGFYDRTGGAATVTLGGLGFPATPVAANSIEVGGVPATHTQIVVDQWGGFTGASLTVSPTAQLGLSDVVVPGVVTYADAAVVGPSSASDVAMTLSADHFKVGDAVTVGLTDVGANGIAAVLPANVSYEFYNNAGTASVSGLQNSGKTVVTAGDEVLFRFMVPDVPNSFDSSGNLLPLQLYAGVDDDGNGTLFNDPTSTQASLSVFVEPSITLNNVPPNYWNGQIMWIDAHGFVAGDNVHVSIDGVAHNICGGDSTINGNGSLSNPGAWIRIGDTNCDGTVDHYFAAGEHTVTMTSDTLGCSASATFTITFPWLWGVRADSRIYTYAPTGTIFAGPPAQITPFTVTDSIATTGGWNSFWWCWVTVPGSTVYLATTAPNGGNLKPSTRYLVMFDAYNDGLNLQQVGSFVSTSDGRAPLNTSFTIPENALPMYHDIYLYEDTNNNGVYDEGVDSPVMWLDCADVYANVNLNTYVRHVGDQVVADFSGLIPSNTPDTAAPTTFQLCLDTNNSGGPDMGDICLPDGGFQADENGHAQLTFNVPEIPGGNLDMYLAQAGTLSTSYVSDGGAGDLFSTLPYYLNNYWAPAGWTTGPDAQIHIAPMISLDSYVGNSGDTVTVTGSGFIPGTNYVITFGYLDDITIGQRGQVVASFTADANGNIPDGVTFTVPAANNPAYGVVVSPTPAANYVDVAVDTGTGLMSVLMAGDQPIFTVGGQASELLSAAAVDTTHVRVSFSGGLQGATAAEATNYALTDTTSSTSVPVISASYDSATYTVTLTTGEDLVEGHTYSLTVSNIRDVYNNLVSGTVSFTYTPINATFNANATSFTGGEDYASNHLDLTVDVTGVSGNSGSVYFILTMPDGSGGSLNFCLHHSDSEYVEPTCGIYSTQGYWEPCDPSNLTSSDAYYSGSFDGSVPFAGDGTYYLYGPGPDSNPDTHDTVLNDGWVPPTSVIGSTCLPNGTYTFDLRYVIDSQTYDFTQSVDINR